MINEALTEDLQKRTRKAPTAFRTISEVSEDLQIPQHVLRFWETKFSQLKPLKRGGGRRYYRPEDIALLKRVSDLLYTQGYTIKGVQRLLKDGAFSEEEEGHPGELALGDPSPAEELDEAPLRDALSELDAIASALRQLGAKG